jgi:hypothetical protein
VIPPSACSWASRSGIYRWGIYLAGGIKATMRPGVNHDGAQGHRAEHRHRVLTGLAMTSTRMNVVITTA